MELRQSITEPEANVADKGRAITAMRVVKRGAAYLVYLRLNWQQEEVFVSTLRNRKQPKEYMHAGRLIAFIEATLPSVKVIQLHL